MSIHLRSIADKDGDLVFNWRNDPYIVERSTSRREVTREEHNEWFNHLLADTSSLGFIVEINGKPSGQLRFDFDGKQCVITFYLTEENTGKGYGVEIIRAGCKAAHQKWPGIPVIACVREDNTPAKSVFLKADFQQINTGCPNGHIAMILKK